MHSQYIARARVVTARLLFVALSSLAIALPAAAAEAWFGLAVPRGMSDPTKPVLSFNNTLSPLSPNAQAAASAADSVLGGPAVFQDFKKIIDFSLESRAAGDTLWGRISGMPGMYRTMEWVAEQLRAAGVRDAKVEDFTCELWWPKAWEVRLLGNTAFGAGTQDVLLGSAFLQQSNARDGELIANLIYVGHGTLADLADKDLAGKVAVLHVNPDPSLFSAPERGVPAQLITRGAAAVISVIESPGNMQYFDGRFGRGNGPCFTVGGQDGFFLERAIGEAANAGKLNDLKVSLKYASENKTGLKTANVVGILPGRSAKNIIVSAHADGFFQGADDNANGLATMLALAKYFGKRPLEHTLVFVASAGHHSPGNGVREFVRKHPELTQNCILAINIEHVAYSSLGKSSSAQRDNFGNQVVPGVVEGPKKVGVSNQSPLLLDLWRKGSQQFGLAVSQRIDSGVPGEGSGYTRSVKAVTQMIGSSVFYHSSGDTLELVPVAGMERAARFHAWYIKEVDKAPEEAVLASGRATGEEE